MSLTYSEHIPHEDYMKDFVKEVVKFEIGDEIIEIEKEIVEDNIRKGKVNFVPFNNTILFLTNEEYDKLVEINNEIKNKRK